MSETVVGVVKLGLALGAALAWLMLPARRRLASWVLGGCALLAVSAYFQFGRLPAGFVHRWEMYHYYVGSKYHAELGYERLYRCAALADAEDGVRQSQKRRIRDLRTDELMHASDAVREPELCRARFSAARWTSFKADVRFFRRGLGRNWEQAQLDHGYNPPPLWTATWGKLTNAVPATRRHLQLLAGADLVLMLGIGVALARSFGWRTAALSAVFWGTQAASEMGWTGGALGRQEWLFCAVLALSLLHRGKWALAGAALMLASLLRLFPSLLFAGAGLVWAASWLWQRRCPLALRRFALGAALAAALGLGVSIADGGANDYREFWSHIQLRHEAVVNNHMGLRTLLSAAPVPVEALASGPTWLRERVGRLEQLGGAFRVFMAFAAAVVLAAIWQSRRAWVGMALATALIPLLLDPANYYYSFFVLLVPLCVTQRAVGVLMCVVAAGGQLLSLRFAAAETRFVALSALYVGVCLLVALAFIRLPALGAGSRKVLHAK